MVCEGAQISVYNVPAAGGSPNLLGTWTWPISYEYGTRYGPTFGCNAGGGVFTVGWLERQQFNTDFTEMAINDNGIVSVEDSGGEPRDVGPAGSTGYGVASPAEESPLFRPGTDTVWYADHNLENQLFSLDPDQPDREPLEHPQYSGEEATSSSGEPNPLPFFYFSPDGKVTVTGDPPGFEGGLLMTPDGRHGVGRSMEFVATRSQAEAPFGESGELDQIPGEEAGTEDSFCRLQGFLSDFEAICSGVTENVYIVEYTPSFDRFVMSSLLPPAPGVEDDSAVGSPDGSEVAFVSQSAAGTAIYKAFLLGGEPEEVTDLGSLGANVESVALLQWK